MPFVVIDRDEAVLEDFKTPFGVPLHGDATSDDVLQRAGIARARYLITVVPSDAANLYITMSARLLNERLFIVARSEDESAEQKLVRAGGQPRFFSLRDRRRPAWRRRCLRPNVLDFLELATRTEHLELNIEETVVSPGSVLVGQTLETSGIRPGILADRRRHQAVGGQDGLQSAARHAAGRARRLDHARHPQRSRSTEIRGRRQQRRRVNRPARSAPRRAAPLEARAAKGPRRSVLPRPRRRPQRAGREQDHPHQGGPRRSRARNRGSSSDTTRLARSTG